MALDNDSIVELLQQFDDESKALTKDLLETTWYMRGGISYSEAMALSPNERLMIHDIIKQNIKNTTDSKLPLL